MWTGFEFKNLKGYKSTGLQKFRRLTILIGPNGGGKSTLLQLFMVLKQTVEHSDTRTTLITSIEKERSGYIDLGQYKDYVYMGDVNQNINIYLSWEPQQNPKRQFRSSSSDRIASEVNAIDVTFSFSSPSKQVVVKKLCYCEKEDNPKEQSQNKEKQKGDEVVQLCRLDKGVYRLDMPNETGQWHDDKLKTSTRFYEPQKFYRFPPALLADLPSDTENRLRIYVTEFEDRILNTFYLGPLREFPSRLYIATGERPADVGLNGKKIGTVLYNDVDKELIETTSDWLQILDIAESVSLSRISKGNIFSLNIRGKGQLKEVNLADYGFGASQILPVIVESLYSPPGATLLIEQPEIHLNAHHQLKLPDFFVELIRETDKQFIIETHSEYFLKRISTLVAKGVIDPEEITVLYCFSDNEGSHIKPIALDHLGRYEWWPEDFLSEGFEGAAEHIDAIQEKTNEESKK